jgi:predicted dehydrogenase
LKFNSFAVILIKFENGVIAKITGNGGCVHPHYHGLKVFGTKRTAIHNLDGSAYLTSSELDSEPIPIDDPYPEKEARQKIIHSFVDSILDHTIAPIVTDSDVYDVMSVCFAAEEAMNTGNTVKVNYLT